MFKSLSVYKLDPAKADSFIALLMDADQAVRDFEVDNHPSWPGKQDLQTRGFVFPPGLNLQETVDPTGLSRSFIPITQVVYAKAIDGAAVNCEVERKVKEISRQEGRNIGRAEKQQIKEEIIFGLLPNAPVKAKHTKAFLTSDGYILIDATGKQAEDFTHHLREALGSLPCLPFAEREADGINTFVKTEIEKRYFDQDSSWLEATGSFCFTIGDENISIKNCDDDTMNGELFQRLQQHGFVKWCEFKTDNATFRLTDAFQLKSLKLELEYEPENEDEEQLSAAWYLFYMEHFLKLANDLRLAVGKFVHTEDETQADD
jgi:DNA recombination-dependent growth factor C